LNFTFWQYFSRGFTPISYIRSPNKTSMLRYRKIAVGLALIAFMILGVAATAPQDKPKPPKRNLKILPKDISKEDLDKVMDGFRDALGVKCNFCHAPSKDPNQKWPDFASDDKPEKNIARKMIKMAAKINKKFFSEYKDEAGQPAAAVTCGTCHHGTAHPEFKAPPHEQHGPPPPPKQ
jgi:hypothetical protein